jgi:hypothetical protein
VQTPDEWLVVPQAGLAEKFGDHAAFREKWGDLSAYDQVDPVEYVSDRWRSFAKRTK